MAAASAEVATLAACWQGCGEYRHSKAQWRKTPVLQASYGMQRSGDQVVLLTCQDARLHCSAEGDHLVGVHRQVWRPAAELLHQLLHSHTAGERMRHATDAGSACAAGAMHAVHTGDYTSLVDHETSRRYVHDNPCRR